MKLEKAGMKLKINTVNIWSCLLASRIININTLLLMSLLIAQLFIVMASSFCAPYSSYKSQHC